MLRLGGGEQRAAVAERFGVAVEHEAGQPHILDALEAEQRAAVAIAQDRSSRRAFDLGAGFEREAAGGIDPGGKE